MKVSKHIRTLVVCTACVGAFCMLSGAGRAQEGEAVNADAVLVPKTSSSSQPVVNNVVVPTEPKMSTADLERVNNKEAAIQASLEIVKKENEDSEILAKKIELATKMNEIRSAREQVDSAVKQAAASLPENERQKFIVSMQSMMNYNAIERISVDAMVETYTLQELDAMVGYFSKPEAKSASDKIIVWAKKVQPEVVRMIDRAMMRIRTGQ